MARKPERDFVRYRSRGDGRALARVFDALAPRLLLVAAHVVPDRAQAEDLVQETFLRAMVSADSYDASRPLFPWLVGILHNEAKKARAASRTPDAARLGQSCPEPRAQAEDRELMERLSDEVASLPEAYRDVLNLRLVHGLKPVEIAHSLGRPPSTVSTQLQRGLARLRRTLPRSFTALVAASASGRGMDAVRAAVLARAHGGAAAITGTLSLGAGILLMKKVSVGVLALGTLAVIWSFLPGRHEPPEVPGPSLASAHVDPISAALEPREVRTDDSAVRETLPRAVVEAAAVLVRVRWARGGGPAPGVIVRLDPHDGSDPRLHGREGATGPDGTVRFDSVVPGRARVSLDRGVHTECEMVAGRRVALELEVPPGVDVAGQVVDAAGRPVADAEVFVDPPCRYSASVPARILPATVSDVYGRFALRQLDSRAGVGARAAGLGHSRILSIPAHTADDGRRELILVIEGPGTDVRGRVVDARGRPVASALVAFGERDIVNPTRLPNGGWATFWQCLYVRTDAHGGFLATGLPLRRLWVRAEAAGHAPYEQRVDVDPAVGTELVIGLAPAGRVFGTVSDADGRPIAGATVLPSRRQTDLLTRVERMRTDARGRFELDDLPAGSVKLLAHADGHARSEVELALEGGIPVEWNPVLAPLPEIRGTVLDAGGQPVARARILAAGEPKVRGIPVTIDSLHDAAAGSTDARGRFSIAVGSGKRYALTLTEDGALAGVSLTDEPVRGGGAELVFRVPDERRATALIRGRVLDVAGQPLEGAWLQLGYGDTLRGVGRSDRSGEFSIGPLPPGRYEVRVSPRESDDAAIALGPFDVYRNQALDLGDVRPGPVGELVFRYTCVDGSRIEKISAHLESVDGKTTEVLAAHPDGKSTSRLPAGEYTLTVFGTGVVSVVDRPVTIRENETTKIDLELEPGARRELRFPTPIPEDWPVGERARVTLRRHGVVEPVTDGRFVVRRPMRYVPSLAPGSYVLELTLDDGRQFRGSFSLEDLAADQAPLQVQMQRRTR